MADQQINKLIDAALALHKEQSNESLSYWEELKNDETRRLHATSFDLRFLKGEYYPCELSVTCDSQKDLSMWNLCLRTALVFQPLPLAVVNASSTRVSMQRTYLDHMKGVLHFISPLLRRTDIVSESIHKKFDKDAKNSEKTLQELIESVHKQSEQETNQLIQLCEELKSDRNRRLSFYHFNLRALPMHSANAVDILLWKACVSIAHIKLEIPENKIRTIQNRSLFKFTVRTSDIARILDYLKPLASRMSIQIVKLYSVQRKIMLAHADFIALTTKNVRLEAVPANSENVDFHLWVNFAQKINPSKVTYVRQGLDHEINDFLIPLAGVVEAITIVETRRITPLKRFPLSAITRMLRGKCRSLKISEINSVISLKGVEDLVKRLHRLNTQVFLGMWSTINSMNIQIGEYRVKSEGNMITIKNA